MKQWWTARDLAAENLPTLPKSDRRIRDYISAVDAAFIKERTGRGGGNETHIDALPQSARAELARRARKAADEQALAASGQELVERQKDKLGDLVLTDQQRRVASARLTVLQEIHRLEIFNASGRTAAVAAFLKSFSDGNLPLELKAAVSIANDRGRGLCRATLFNWIALNKDGVAALAPKPTRPIAIRPFWLDSFMQFWARPQKPDLAECHRQFIEQCWPEIGAGLGPAPTLRQVKYVLSKLSHFERARGRDGKLALRASQAYKIRDASELQPSMIYVADGTTFDAEVAHPIHGKPFKPEIVTILDVATRRAVGWSAGLAEGWQGTADALRRAAQVAIPAVFYSDRGPGYVNAKMGDELTGVLARLGTTAMRALPYHSWSKGNVERFQKHWVALAKNFATYLGAGMDKEAAQAVHKRTRRDIALFGASKILPEWSEFTVAVEAYINDYNDRPHRSLPWVRDELGRKCHMSPNQLWASKIAAGCEVIAAEQSELVDLFHPAEIRAARRCMVTLNTNSYFSTELDRHHGQDVFVLYDVRDASRVLCRTVELVDGERRPGRFICWAEFEGNKTRYIPLTYERQALEKRAEGRKRRLNRKLDVVEAELRPSIMFEAQPVPVAANPYFPNQPAAYPAGDDVALSSPGRGDLKAASVPDPVERDSTDAAAFVPFIEGRPIFRDDESFAAWCLANPTEVSEPQREYLRELLDHPMTLDELRRHGLDCKALYNLTIQQTPRAAAV